MSRLRRFAAWLSLLGAAGLLLVATAALSHMRGWWVPAIGPAELSGLLRPYDQVFVPEGDGPFPTVVMFHGCSGLASHYVEWAEALKGWGYASVVVDSFRGRGLRGGLDGEVCAGRTLLGAQRAGDVLVSLEDLRRLPFVDSERLIAAGWSHGGWAVMEFLALESLQAPPPGLRSRPVNSGKSLLGSLRGVFLLYPYCGVANLATDWRAGVPSLFLLAGEDSVVVHEECLAAVANQRSRGNRSEAEVFDGVDHAFDKPLQLGDSTTAHDPEMTDAARQRVREFLAAVTK